MVKIILEWGTTLFNVQQHINIIKIIDENEVEEQVKNNIQIAELNNDNFEYFDCDDNDNTFYFICEWIVQEEINEIIERSKKPVFIKIILDDTIIEGKGVLNFSHTSKGESLLKLSILTKKEN